MAKIFSWPLLLAEAAARTFFVSCCVLRLFCFFGDGNDGGAGDRWHLNEIFLVSPWFVFCLRSESSLSSCWTFSSKVLLFSLCRLIDVEDLFLRIGLVFSIDLLLLVILSFRDKLDLSECDLHWKVVLIRFCFRFFLLAFRRILA